MDGVPVKISEKYKPRKKIVLPSSVVNKLNSVAVQFEEYDFSFEKSVLDQISKISEFKKSAEEKKKKKKKEEFHNLEEAVEKMSVEVSPETPPSPSLTQDSTSSVPYTVPQSTNQTTILTPVPVVTNSQALVKRNIDNSLLSEFESDTSSPFDNMELKSINDLQELADVLGSSNQPSKESKPTQPINGVTSHWNNNSNSNMYKYPMPHQYYTNLYSNPITQTSIYGYSGSVAGINSSLPVCSPQHTYSPVHHTNRVSTPYISSYGQTPPVPPKPPSMSSKVFPSTVYPSTSHYQAAHITQAAKPITMHLSSLQEPTSSTVDPAELNLWRGLHNTVIERRTSAQEKKNQVVSICNIEENCKEMKSSLPNPLPKLSSESQQLAHKMSEMGFPLPRAARAVQLFGNDEAKVIEFLLLVQKFEDCPAPGDRVETALIANDLNEQATLNYLENIKKLVDFGFQEEKVVEALSKCNNNTDRALDFLIA